MQHTAKDDIDIFLDHVVDTRNELVSRGHDGNIEIIHLFNGLKACKDAEFREAIKRLHDKWEDDDPLVDVDYVIEKARAKYKARDETTLAKPSED